MLKNMQAKLVKNAINSTVIEVQAVKNHWNLITIATDASIHLINMIVYSSSKYEGNLQENLLHCENMLLP